MPWEDTSNDPNAKKMAQDPWGDEDSGGSKNSGRRPTRLDEYRNRPRPNGGGQGGGGRGPRRPSNDLDDIMDTVMGQLGPYFNALALGALALVSSCYWCYIWQGAGFISYPPHKGRLICCLGKQRLWANLA